MHHTKTTAAQNEVALSYYSVRGLYFLEVVFVATTVYTVVAHMLVTTRINYSMIYAYAVSFIECIDTHN